ncbi:MAG: glycosyltransferase family 4 protein [Deltaproteobacteria bacterium]|nr:glycosyltransferase family 4 protein [Deltaproteobacteria bacterium]
MIKNEPSTAPGNQSASLAAPADKARVAYVLLWFPKPSETFIFREVLKLWELGLPVKVFALYGEVKKELTPEMAVVSSRVERLGIPYLAQAPSEVAHWLRRKPRETVGLFREVLFRRWSCLEVAGESIWAFFGGLRLARRFLEQGIEHIHADWANGPATAAWVASRLTGIPFSFTGRAGDIFPQDGALSEKIRDCAFVRTDVKNNVDYLASFANGQTDKIRLVYASFTLRDFKQAPVEMRPPYRLLALGRFVRTKGFDVLLHAARIMKDSGFPFHLTIAGSGPRGPSLKLLCRQLGLGDCISFPGYVTHDRVSELFAASDVFVMPSVVHKSGDRDGIPNVLVEAFAHGVPVVATDVSGIKEIVINEETGLLIPERDPEAVAEAIRAMIRDREKALEMAEKGKALVLKQFNPEQNGRQLFDLFLQAANKRRDSVSGATKVSGGPH